MGDIVRKLLSNSFVLFVIFIVIAIIIPLPSWLLDFMILLNISLSLIILVMTMFIKEALEFSVFPTVLLLTTVLRLSLNVSTTRGILSSGYAGEVISAFGNFVMGGDAIVGFLIFIIIVLVNFIVITKGSERVSEVAARFTLDAMPGKQMAIDADLNAGIINEEQAKKRRSNIQREADFYGSMDGATKFVKGDAIMSIVTTLVNLIGGVIIGMVIAVIRTAHDSRRAGKGSIILNILNAVCKLYLIIIRGTPMMVQLLIMGFVIMVPKDDTARMVCGIVTLGINSGAYVAEIVRGGLMSVGAGQMEAGRSLGLNYGQTMWLIIIPQAIKNILPALGNEMITLFKDTSLVSVIALRDVTKQAQNIVSTTYQPYVPYISLAVIYLLGVIIMTKLLGIFERRLRESDRR